MFRLYTVYIVYTQQINTPLKSIFVAIWENERLGEADELFIEHEVKGAIGLFEKDKVPSIKILRQTFLRYWKLRDGVKVLKLDEHLWFES